MRKKRAFTLIEMLLAVILASILMGGVLAVAAGLSRDRARMNQSNLLPMQISAATLLERDLKNSLAMSAVDQVTLIGQGSIDAISLEPTHRLVKITWRLDTSSACLIRQQIYLDDAVRPAPWTAIVATGVKSWSLQSNNNAVQIRLSDTIAEKAGLSNTVAAIGTRARLRLQTTQGTIDQELNLR